MPHLLFLFLALPLLSSLSVAVSPAQVPPNGKAQGFLNSPNNPYSEPAGDWLTSTLCYCHSPERAKDDWHHEKAHIFQHEYYNYHSNATFVADHICLSRARIEADQCVRPSVPGDNNDWRMENGFVCKKFLRTDDEKTRQGNSKRKTRRVKRKTPHLPTNDVCFHDCDMGPFAPDPDEKSSHPDHDKVCFAVDTNFYGTVEMEMTFNRQRRKMAKSGEQGRIKTGFDEVSSYCEDMCQSHFQMPADMNIDDKRADGGSRQFVYTDLDDMCDHCR